MTLIEWLKATHTTRKEVSEKLGVTQSMISQVVSGKRLFHPTTAAKLIRLSKGAVTYDDLYGKNGAA